MSLSLVGSCVIVGVLLGDYRPNGRLVSVSGEGSVTSCGGTGFHWPGVVECHISVRIPFYADLARQRRHGMVEKHGDPGGGGRPSTASLTGGFLLPVGDTPLHHQAVTNRYHQDEKVHHLYTAGYLCHFRKEERSP
jgi:hypothetical protein